MISAVRRLLAILAVTAACCVTTLVTTAQPASAAGNGDLLISTGGSLFTEAPVVFQGLVPGVTRSFKIKVVNTDSVVRQYELKLQPSFNNHTVALYLGSKKLPLPYFTAPLDPGQSVTLSLKVTLPADAAPTATYFTEVDLVDPVTAALVEDVTVKDQPSRAGTTRNGLYVKTGTQPFVGGFAAKSHGETAAALKVGNTATFTLRLQNDGATAAEEIELSTDPPQGCATDYTFTIKKGTKDITAAVADGVYSTGPLAPGSHTDYKVLVKRINSTPCLGATFILAAPGPDGTITELVHVAAAA